MKHIYKCAVYIDGDGTPAWAIGYILAKLREYGEVRFIAVYGKTGNGNFENWRKVAAKYKITLYPLERDSGKNAADMKMTMDIDNSSCSNNNITTFCIVASDYDFTPVAKKIIANGYDVVGFGNVNSPLDFQAECTVFYLLHREERFSPQAPNPNANGRRPMVRCNNLNSFLQRSFDRAAGRSSCVSRSQMIKEITTQKSVVPLESNDYIQWWKIIDSTDLFDVYPGDDGTNMVRMRKR